MGRTVGTRCSGFCWKTYIKICQQRKNKKARLRLRNVLIFGLQPPRQFVSVSVCLCVGVCDLILPLSLCFLLASLSSVLLSLLLLCISHFSVPKASD